MELEGSLPHSHVPGTFQTLPIPFFILGISQLGHKTRPGHCNMQYWRFSSDGSCMCVFEVFLTALSFSDLLPPPSELVLHSCKCLLFLSALGREGRTWEHEAHVWVGCKLWRRGNNLPCWVYYSKFLDFFPVWGEHSVNRGWRCTGEDMCQVCGHRPLLHKSTMGLAQEWTPPR